MAMPRFLTASVMYVGSVSGDSDVKAPSDLLLLRLNFGSYEWEREKNSVTIFVSWKHNILH